MPYVAWMDSALIPETRTRMQFVIQQLDSAEMDVAMVQELVWYVHVCSFPCGYLSPREKRKHTGAHRTKRIKLTLHPLYCRFVFKCSVNALATWNVLVS